MHKYKYFTFTRLSIINIMPLYTSQQTLYLQNEKTPLLDDVVV